MRGGKPGYFPPSAARSPTWSSATPASRASGARRRERLNVEVNNGRLAMIGLFGFLAEANCPGAVPGLTA